MPSRIVPYGLDTDLLMDVPGTQFYHFVPDANFDKKESVQSVLDNIKAGGVGSFIYFRWDDARKKYLRYATT